MAAFDHVLVGLDGSRESEAVIDWVRELFPKSRMLLVRVLEPVVPPSPDGSAVALQVFTDAAESYLREIAGRYEPRPKTLLRFGSVARRLIEAARREGCDLIALATRGGHKLERRMLGGTTEAVLHGTHVPVLVVPAGCAAPGKKGISRIGVPLDGSDESERILPLASELAREHGAGLRLIHAFAVLDDAERLHADLWGHTRKTRAIRELEETMTRHEKSVKQRFRDLAGKLRRSGVPTREVLVRGRPPAPILKAARAEKVDLLALRVHGHGAFEHLLHGALASRIVQESDRPLLVVRHDVLEKKGKGARKK